MPEFKNKVVMKYFILIFLFASITAHLSAADYTWSGGSSQWKNDGNWNGPAGWPDDETDRAIFKDNAQVANVPHDLVLGEVQVINGKYKMMIQLYGSLTLSNTGGHSGSLLIQDSGDAFIFNCRDKTLTVSGDLVINDGLFRCSSGTINVSQDFTHTGGTFDHKNGTISMGTTTDSTITVNSTIFHNLIIDGGPNATISLGASLDLEGDFILKSGSFDTVSYDMTVAGDFDARGGTFIAQTGAITFDGTVQQDFYSGGNVFYDVYMNQREGLLNLAQSVTFDNSLIVHAGVVTAGDVTLAFKGGSSFRIGGSSTVGAIVSFDSTVVTVDFSR